MFIKVEGDTTKGYHHNRIFDKEVGDIPRIIFLIKRGGMIGFFSSIQAHTR